MPEAEDSCPEDESHLDIEPRLDYPARGAEQLHQRQRHDAADQNLPGGLDPEMDEPPPPEQVGRHVADGRKGDQVEQDQRYQVDHQNGYDPGGFPRSDHGPDHVVGEYHHNHDNAGGRPTRRLNIFSALIDEPQRSLVAAAVLDEDEHHRNHRNRTRKTRKTISRPPKFPRSLDPIPRAETSRSTP